VSVNTENKLISIKTIDWSQLKKKVYRAPIVPQLKDTEDVSQFAEDFTMQKPEDLSAERPTQPNAEDYFRGRIPFLKFNSFINRSNFFNSGYSFVAPKYRRKCREETKTQSNRLEPERPILSKVLQYQTYVSLSFSLDLHRLQ
jgi:hypothetical protein